MFNFCVGLFHLLSRRGLRPNSVFSPGLFGSVAGLFDSGWTGLSCSALFSPFREVQPIDFIPSWLYWPLPAWCRCSRCHAPSHDICSLVEIEAFCSTTPWLVESLLAVLYEHNIAFPASGMADDGLCVWPFLV